MMSSYFCEWVRLRCKSLSLNNSNKFEITKFSQKSFTILLGFTESLQSFLLSILSHPRDFLKPKLKMKYYENPTNHPRAILNLSKNLVWKDVMYYVPLSFIPQLSLIAESFTFFFTLFQIGKRATFFIALLIMNFLVQGNSFNTACNVYKRRDKKSRSEPAISVSQLLWQRHQNVSNREKHFIRFHIFLCMSFRSFVLLTSPILISRIS